jgi:hypothetical protein
MALDYYQSINLHKGEIQNVRIQNLPSAPAGPVEGLIYYDTTLHQFGHYNGTAWEYVSSVAGLNLKADKTITINGHDLSANVTLNASDVGLGNVLNVAQIPATDKGAANGVATLDGSGRLTTSQIPTVLTGAMVYQGTWNAATNSPALASGTGTKGQYYKVSNAGSTAIDGNSNWTTGDLIIFNGTTWDKVEGGSPDVVSVAGRIGAVVLTTADVAASTNKNYVTDAQAVVIGNTSNTNTGDETITTIKSKLGITTLSGSNTGDQTITLTGDVTGSGTGSFATTIAASSVTLAKMSTLAANSFIGNNTASNATPIALTVAQAKTLLAITEADVTNLTTDLAARALLTTNTFTGKQTFVAPTTAIASVLLPNGAANPTTPVSGDLWANTGVIKWYNGTTTKNIAFTDSAITGSAAGVTGGLVNQILYQTAASTTGFITTANSGVLITSAAGVPSIATTLPAVNGSALTGLTGAQITGNIAGSAANVTGTVAIANGGTGQTTQQAALNALSGTQSSGKYLRSDGANTTLASIQAADVPTLNQNTTGTAANVTGVVAIANGGTGAATAALARTALAVPTKYSVAIGNGALTSFVITHNLGTQDFVFDCWDISVSPRTRAVPSIVNTDANNATVSFSVAPTTNQFQLIFIG